VPASKDPVGEGIAALSRFFLGDSSLTTTLTRIAELARVALSADIAGITMLVRGQPETGVCSDPIAHEIDQWNCSSQGRGPGLDASRHQMVYGIPDTATEDRWPEFAAEAASHGIRSTLSLPLGRTGIPLGALNLYSCRPARFNTNCEDAQMLAAQAGIALANGDACRHPRQLSEDLNHAQTARRTIDSAVGMLMSIGGRSPDQAFQRLVRAADQQHRRLNDIAAEVVAAARLGGESRPTPVS
jgi:GAF domain-containing protein